MYREDAGPEEGGDREPGRDETLHGAYLPEDEAALASNLEEIEVVYRSNYVAEGADEVGDGQQRDDAADGGVHLLGQGEVGGEKQDRSGAGERAGHQRHVRGYGPSVETNIVSGEV